MLKVAILLAVLQAAFANTVVTNGAYCTQSADMAVQPGTYTVNECGTRCDSENFMYFSHVPSTSQCLCSHIATNQLVNPGANCYSIPESATNLVANGAYCTQSAGLTTQEGTYTVSSCNTKCSSESFQYFSFVPSSSQCLCSQVATNQLVNPGADCYSITESPEGPPEGPEEPETPEGTSLVTNGAYCTQSSELVTQVGTYTVSSCGDQCKTLNYQYFSYAPSSSQCLCSHIATNQLENTGANCYSLPFEDFSVGSGANTNGVPVNNVPASSAALGSPYNVWGDNNGNVYFSDVITHSLYKINPAGTIFLFAGSADGTSGMSTDGDAIANAKFNRPRGLWGKGNNLYVADTSNRVVWRIDLTTETIHLFAGTGVKDTPASSGPALSSPLFTPFDGYIDSADNTYLIDFQKCMISKINSAGDISLFAGTPGTCANDVDNGADVTAMTINKANSIYGDNEGNLYFTEFEGHRIRKVTPGGAWSTIIGDGTAATSGDGALAVNAQTNSPSGVWIDPFGNIYFTQATAQGVLRSIDRTTGIVSTIRTGLSFPRKLWGDGSRLLYVPDSANHVLRKYHIGSGVARRRLAGNNSNTKNLRH